MSANGLRQTIGPDDAQMRLHHETLISAEYDRCHPGDSFEALKRRARFSKEDKGLLMDWMARAALKAKTAPQRPADPPPIAA